MPDKWTDDQRDAIKSVGRATVVSAAAGSGKTAVLIERTIRLLADPEKDIQADRLLAVTFTNDAANQMKEKLSAAMSERLESDPENSWVARQQELLPLAGICTIDSFCMDLVRSNINEFEISGNFTVIDQEENRILTEKAFEEAAEYYYENFPEKMKILNDNFAEEDDSEVIKYGKELLRFKGSMPFPEQWKRNTYADMEAQAESYVKAQYEKAVKSIDSIAAYAEEIEELACEVGAEEKYAPVLECLMGFSENAGEKYKDMKEILDSAEFQAAEKVKFPSRPKRNSVSESENFIYDRINSCKVKIKDRFKAIHSVKFVEKEEILRQKECIIRIFDLLWDFVKKAEETLYGYKLEKNKLYFSDITRMTIELLAVETDTGFERTELAQKIVDEQRYKIILIDEFQDVNNLQDVIFKCISDTDDLNILGRNVFVVGDVKQSIYRFRQSNPAVFEKAKQLAENKENEDKSVSVTLRKNFRSRRNIIDFANFVFQTTMTPQLGEVDYNSGEALDAGADYPGKDHSAQVILLDGYVEDDDSPEDTDDDIPPECTAVASQIKAMIDGKVPVYENGVPRPCRPGDFCILLRTGKLAAQYIKAVENVNLKAVTDSVKGYLGAREVSLAISMLKVIDNPMQDIPFAAVCMSPVFGFTPDEMSEIRLLDKSRRKKFYQLFLGISRDERAKEYGYEPIATDNRELAAKCGETIKTISKLRFYAAGMSLEKLIRKLYDSTDFMSIAAAFENSQQKRANLRMLVKYASDYENSSGGGLGDFLRYLDRVSETGSDFDEALTVAAGSGTVFVKTIHKSKGLEYPFVIVGDMAREYNIPKQADKLFLNEHTGIGMTLREKLPKCNRHTVFYDHVYETGVKEQLSEELRIFYVALTRAKEKLIFPLYFKNRGKNRLIKAAEELSSRKSPSWEDVSKLMSYSEILGYAMLFSKYRAPLLEQLGFEGEDLPESELQPEIDFSVRTPVISGRQDDDKLPAKPVDIRLFGQISENISRSGETQGESTVSKLTVTEFVRELEQGSAQADITYFPPVPSYENDTKKATAAEKGTDTHLFMELADFEKAAQNVREELSRLVGLNKMTESQAENVDIPTVEGFFESEIYQLCKTSLSLMREKKFMVKLSEMELSDPAFAGCGDKDIMLQGIADLILEREDGCIIVDYKTDNVSRPEELVERHRLQLLLYRGAFDRLLDKKVTACYIYSFKLRQAVKVELNNLQ